MPDKPTRKTLLGTMLGGRDLRSNRHLDAMKGSSMLAKVPRDIAADEYNAVFGVGGRNAIAAGASVTFTSAAPRDLILRELTLNCDGGMAEVVVCSVTAVNVEGNTAQLGGAVGGAQFAHDATNKPSFDLPAAGGTPVQVIITNNSAAALFATPSFTID